jgi:hypothetical protein
MQHMTSYEKKWLENGINKGRADAEKLIETALRWRFGADAATSFMPKIRSMSAEQFQRAVGALETITSPEELLGA